MVLDPRGLIKKTNLTFASKFFWLLVHHRLSSIAADNMLTWDRAVFLATLVVGLEIDVAKSLISVIHKRDFKFSTTYPFPCMIYQLCRDAGVPIWHRDVLHTPTGTVDTGLIRDEANEVAPWCGPRVDVQPLGENLRTR